MEDLITQIDNAVLSLKLKTRKVDEIIVGGDEREISRYARIIGEQLEKVYEYQNCVIELKVAAKASEADISQWSDEVAANAKVYEDIFTKLNIKLQELETATRDDYMQTQTDSETRRRRDSFGLTAHHYTPVPVSNGGRIAEPQQTQVLKWKLPKLDIEPFGGTHLDWPRFWNQFLAEVDNVPIATVTKFSYLRKYILPNVQCLIDGLPFDDVGYVKAKEILTDKYGQETEVINAHVQEIMSLPTITSANSVQIHAFYRKLVVHVRSLETMDKLGCVGGYVRNVLDKLPKIRSDLVRLDKRWKEWDFMDLEQALCEWTERNPVQESEIKDLGNKMRTFKVTDGGSSTQHTQQTSTCVYCDKSHKSIECTKVKEIPERRALLSSKRLCFNCTKGGHPAWKCKSRGCTKCGRKHHTSLCDSNENTEGGGGGANGAGPAAAAGDSNGLPQPLMCAPDGCSSSSCCCDSSERIQMQSTIRFWIWFLLCFCYTAAANPQQTSGICHQEH